MVKRLVSCILFYTTFQFGGAGLTKYHISYFGSFEDRGCPGVELPADHKT